MTDYWIKLYIEILDDPKMATLPDRLWRRVIELFLCAGRVYHDGQLPDTNQLAWMIRVPMDELDLDLKQIATTGIIQQTKDGWLIPKFSQRQAAATNAERVKQHREREHKAQYYSDTASNEHVTLSYTDQIRSDTEQKKKGTAAPAAAPKINPDKILCDASGLSAFPGDQRQWHDVIYNMAEDHGVEATTRAMKQACDKWVATIGKNGRPYRKTNLAWINNAQEILTGGSIDGPPKTTAEMTDAEYTAYKLQEANR